MLSWLHEGEMPLAPSTDARDAYSGPPDEDVVQHVGGMTFDEAYAKRLRDAEQQGLVVDLMEGSGDEGSQDVVSIEDSGSEEDDAIIHSDGDSSRQTSQMQTQDVLASSSAPSSSASQTVVQVKQEPSDCASEHKWIRDPNRSIRSLSSAAFVCTRCNMQIVARGVSQPEAVPEYARCCTGSAAYASDSRQSTPAAAPSASSVGSSRRRIKKGTVRIDGSVIHGTLQGEWYEFTYHEGDDGSVIIDTYPTYWRSMSYDAQQKLLFHAEAQARRQMERATADADSQGGAASAGATHETSSSSAAASDLKKRARDACAEAHRWERDRHSTIFSLTSADFVCTRCGEKIHALGTTQPLSVPEGTPCCTGERAARVRLSSGESQALSGAPVRQSTAWPQPTFPWRTM